jgi:hypothetical protein
MSNYSVHIIILLFLGFLLFTSFKLRLFGAINFILGLVILSLLSWLDFFRFKHLDAITSAFMIFSFISLHISTLLTSFFADYKEKFFFVFPTFCFLILILVYCSISASNNIFFIGFFLRIFLSFFPLHFYSYYRRYKSQDNEVE